MSGGGGIEDLLIEISAVARCVGKLVGLRGGGGSGALRLCAFIQAISSIASWTIVEFDICITL